MTLIILLIINKYNIGRYIENKTDAIIDALDKSILRSK